MSKYIFVSLVFCFFCINLCADESTAKKIQLSYKIVEYGDDEKFEGYVARNDKVTDLTPGILLIHNWKGVTEETKKQANRFAALGYVVFAVDVYGKGIRPKNTEEAGFYASKFKNNRKLFRERLLQGLTELKKQKNVDASRIAVVGYCFGGTGAIELARSGADILGAISFHGGLDSPTPEDGKNIKAKVLALCGAIDPYVPAADNAAFEAEMNQHNVDYQVVRYGGAVHSFTDEGAGLDISKGAAYNAIADSRSYIAAQIFLSDIFKPKK